jgi:inorganic pyrophosphatase
MAPRPAAGIVLSVAAIVWSSACIASFRARPAMASLLHVSPGDKLPERVNVIVEIPKGSLNKYEFDPEERVIELDRVLAGSEPYPVEYGFVPQTLMPDGDPLDFVMLVTEPSFPGVRIEARPIGVMRMLDGGDVDDKIVCVPTEDLRFRDVRTLDDVPSDEREAIAQFFSTYKNAQGKTTSVPGWGDVAQAHRLIEAAHAKYRERAGRARAQPAAPASRLRPLPSSER